MITLKEVNLNWYSMAKYGKSGIFVWEWYYLHKSYWYCRGCQPAREVFSEQAGPGQLTREQVSTSQSIYLLTSHPSIFFSFSYKSMAHNWTVWVQQTSLFCLNIYMYFLKIILCIIKITWELPCRCTYVSRTHRFWMKSL